VAMIYVDLSLELRLNVLSSLNGIGFTFEASDVDENSKIDSQIWSMFGSHWYSEQHFCICKKMATANL